MNANIRILETIEEAKKCAALMSETDPWTTLGKGYEDCLKLFLDWTRDIYIAKKNDDVIAFCVVQTDSFPFPYIKSLAVHPSYRGKGLGTKLLKMSEEKYGRINGKIFIGVSSFNDDASRLYQRSGYRKIGELKDYLAVGHSEILMEKVLAENVDQKQNEAIYVSADRSEMDIDFIYENLKTLYWATNLSRENLVGRIMNSINFGVFVNKKQVGFARVITDYFSFSYIADVFVEEKERGKGYSKLLMEYILNYPTLKDSKWLLATRDMHGLYAKFGFTAVNNPDRFMGKNGWRAF
jgi:ribosomal protein S18 acetylase RimI-like enzyme